MKPSLEFRLPRLYVFIIIMAILFSALNVLILFYGQNLFIYFGEDALGIFGENWDQRLVDIALEDRGELFLG